LFQIIPFVVSVRDVPIFKVEPAVITVPAVYVKIPPFLYTLVPMVNVPEVLIVKLLVMT
jgi:hypothetical protein